MLNTCSNHATRQQYAKSITVNTTRHVNALVLFQELSPETRTEQIKEDPVLSSFKYTKSDIYWSYYFNFHKNINIYFTTALTC